MILLLPQYFALANDQYASILKEFKKYNQQFNVPTIGAAKIRPAESILVDVRSPAEQQVSMIPGAITVAEFEKNKHKYKNKIVITYCTIGYRSGRFAGQLIKENFNAFNLEGSLLGWVHTNGQLLDAKGRPTKKLHIYSKGWNYLPKGFIPVY